MIDLAASVIEQRTAQGIEVPGCVKTSSDLARYRFVLATVQPAWCVETGSYLGRSAQFFADEAGCRVVSIDTHPQVSDELMADPRITWIHGNSVDPQIVDTITHLVAGPGPVMVVLDSDHSANHVYAEMVAYAPMVTPGSYMVVEDGIVAWLPEQLVHYNNSSPLDAVERFLAEQGDDWHVDMSIEDMSRTTQHPHGWLMRV